MGRKRYLGMVHRGSPQSPGSIRHCRGSTGDRYQVIVAARRYVGTYLTVEEAEAALLADHERQRLEDRYLAARCVQRICDMIPLADRRAMWSDDDDPIAAFFVERGYQLTLEEIGSLYGLTRERIRQVQEVALRKARTAAEMMDIDCPMDRRTLWDEMEETHG